jgi:hypothetical protein
MASPNKFFVASNKVVLTDWDVHACPPDGFPIDCRYFGNVLRNVDTLLGPRNLEFYLIWDLDSLPAGGRNVVVILVGDERYQIPSYASEVLAVFKTGALEPFRPYAGRKANPFLKIVDEVRTLRDGVLRIKRARLKLNSNVFPVPLGYHQQVVVPFRPFQERTLDVFFAGGRGEPFRVGSPHTWLPRPRTVARGLMFRAIDSISERDPSLVCYTTAGARAVSLGPQIYSEHLMNTKISLCPRGNFPETFRLFESARAGCAIVSEPLPPAWYFEGCPAQIVSDWSDAPNLIVSLLSSPDLLQLLHERTVAWWDKVVGERALARFMTKQIDRLAFEDKPETTECT